MAKTRIAPNETLDVLNADELRDVLAEFAYLFETKDYAEDVRPEENGKTDANGHALIEVYTVPPGMKLRVVRIVFKADGFTFAAPWVNAAGYFNVLRNGQVVDGGPLAAGIPTVGTDSSSAGPRYRNGEVVAIEVFGGPLSTNLTVLVEGDLFPLSRP